jgi:DNA replication protein DnaC
VEARLSELDAQIKAEKAELQRRWEEQQRRAMAERLFAAARCPARHVLALDRLDEQNARWIRIRNLLVDRVPRADGFLVALLGIRGCGKTLLATSVAHQACQQLLSSKYVKGLDLFRRLRLAYTPVAKGQAGVSEEQLVDEFTAPELLIIDEVHQRGETQAENNALVNLLDRRYDDRKATLLVGNLNREDFRVAMGDSIVSRLHETGQVFDCNWPSYRKPGAWQEPTAELRVPMQITSGARRIDN